MELNEPLSEVNFLLFAAKNYDNPSCYDTLEFYEDLNRFKYIKRLLMRFHDTGELRDRLVLNHLIVLYNVFGPATTKMLFVRLDGFLEYLTPFLDMMGLLPVTVNGVGLTNKTINSRDIIPNAFILAELKKL